MKESQYMEIDKIEICSTMKFDNETWQERHENRKRFLASFIRTTL